MIDDARRNACLDAIRNEDVIPCYDCGFWDDYYEICRMPETDMGYNCDVLLALEVDTVDWKNRAG